MKIKLNNVIGSYVALLEPKEDLSGNGVYSIDAIISPEEEDQLDALRANIEQVAIEKFGPKASAMLKSGKLNSPLRFAEDSTAEFTNKPPYEGNYFIKLKTKAEYSSPKVVGKNPREIITDPDDCYSGCTFNLIGKLYAYDTSGQKGVGAIIQAAQVISKGPRLDSGVDPATEFDFIDGGKSDDEFFDEVA